MKYEKPEVSQRVELEGGLISQEWGSPIYVIKGID